MLCRKVHGLEEFLNLEELVLDNNEIDSTTDFPHLAHLHTLTLNKNKVFTSTELQIMDVVCKFPYFFMNFNTYVISPHLAGEGSQHMNL